MLVIAAKIERKILKCIQICNTFHSTVTSRVPTNIVVTRYSFKIFQTMFEMYGL